MPANQPPVEAIQGDARAREVIQADRDAAAAVYGNFRDHDFAGWIRKGENAGGDANFIIQLFARHRLAFQSEARAVPPDEREESDDLIARIDAEIERITGFHPAKQILADCRARLSLPLPADREAIARVREAAQSVIDNAVSSYGSRGKDRYIEDDSGEKMMLVPHDDWYELQQALILALSPTPWQTVDSAPHACHVLAARLDEAHGQWIYAVVASPPSKPFTHWRPLLEPPEALPPATEKAEK